MSVEKRSKAIPFLDGITLLEVRESEPPRESWKVLDGLFTRQQLLRSARSLQVILARNPRVGREQTDVADTLFRS